jgi:tetratricopeptide (TPR) repeat protein
MKRYFDALDAFNHVTGDIKEELAHAYCGRGVALYALERIEEALQLFEKADKLDQMIIHVNFNYRHTIQNITSVIEGILRTDPEDISAYKRKGDVLLLLGERIHDAIDAYTKAIEHGDRSAEVYCCRGEAYYRRNEYHRSLRDYRKALAIDPNYLPAEQGEKKVRSMMRQSPGHFMKKFALWVRTRIDPISVVQTVLKQR